MNTPSFLGSNISLVKASNLRAVLFSLLYRGNISRIQLAQETSLSATTITNLIDELIKQGIVTEDPQESSRTSRREVGRPRTALRLIPDSRYAVGVHIGIGTYRVGVVNLCGEVHQNEIRTYDRHAPAEQVIGTIAEEVNQMIRSSQLETSRIIGVGVGAPGLTDYRTGVNIFAPNLGWRNLPLRDWFSARLNLPVVVDNNVRAMAVGENFFGMGRGVGSLAFVYGRVGIGAGIVIHNQLYRGASLNAGEIGHTVMIPDGGELCRCGRHGCLETLVSEEALIRQARSLAELNPNSLLASLLAQKTELNPIERIFLAAREGDLGAIDLINRAARYLGLALANLVNILNPELIVLGGMFAQGKDLLLPITQKTVREVAMAPLGETVMIRATEHGWRAGMIGAAALALVTFFYQNGEEF